MESAPSDRFRQRWRLPTIALVVMLLVMAAGCATIDDPSGATTSSPVPTQSPEETETDGVPTTDSADPTETPTDTPTATPTAVTPQEPDISGLMTVVVAGEERPQDGHVGANGRVVFDETEAHTWHAVEGVTLAEALSALGIDATAETVTADGTTYDDRDDGTTVAVRVNGNTVDPTSYTLVDGDEVWVTVETAEVSLSVPGEYIPAADQHIHGPIDFEVEGESVDFSQDRYQSNHQYFHFEGGHASPWHAHSFSITLEYALDSVDGIEVSADGQTVIFDGTTYEDGSDGASVSITVNGESIEPGDYFLKDGDVVSVVLDREP